MQDSKFHTAVYLPSNCGIGSKVEGAPPAITSRASKQQAALHALRLLYQAGKLNDHLQPVWITQRHSKQLGECGWTGGGDWCVAEEGIGLSLWLPMYVHKSSLQDVNPQLWVCLLCSTIGYFCNVLC